MGEVSAAPAGGEKWVAVKVELKLLWPRMSARELRERGVEKLSGSWIMTGPPSEEGPLDEAIDAMEMRCLESAAQAARLYVVEASREMEMLLALRDIASGGQPALSEPDDSEWARQARGELDARAYKLEMSVEMSAQQTAARARLGEAGANEIFERLESAFEKRAGAALLGEEINPFSEFLRLIGQSDGGEASACRRLIALNEQRALDSAVPRASARASKPSL